MGLDMYLDAKNSFYKCKWDEENSNERETNDKIRKIFPEMFETGNLNYIKIAFEVGYWRKANHIHKWFVDNCQNGKDDCQASYVSRDNLKKLLTICKKIKKNPEIAQKLLPTQAGFFFGSENYDKYYMNDITSTIAIIEQCLKLPKEWEFSYSSW